MAETTKNAEKTEKKSVSHPSFGFYYKPSRDMTIKYDDIVDRSKFVSTAETKRGKIAGNVGAGEVGLYDYQADEKIDPKNRISDIELLIRAGKLDKADIQTLKKLREQQMISENEAAALKEEDKANRTRQGKLDKLLGIDDKNAPSDSKGQ